MSEPTGGQPERADVLTRKAAAAALTLQREYFVRAVRFLQAMNGYDPQQTLQTPAFRLPEEIPFTVLLGDANQPPFRTNGKAVQVAATVGAVAGNGGYLSIGVKPPSVNSQGAFFGALVIDWVKAIGASQFHYGIEKRFLTGGALPAAPIDLEGPPTKAADAGTTPAPPDRGQLSDVAWIGSTGATTLVLVDGTDFSRIGFLQATATVPDTDRLTDVVIWPGEQFVVQATTVNLAVQLAVHGRYFSFGSAAGSGSLVGAGA